ncbi:MAG TPA: DUF3108 domain-containing protein [bacterium]|jgi:hypothetical protein|nr:DUF3108 domain-containing protein [bacterium]
MRLLGPACALPLLLAGCAGSGQLLVRTGPATLPPPLEPASAAGLSPTAQAQVPASLVVRRGDSLWSLARRQWGRGGAWPVLAKVNGLSAPWILQPGLRLRLPGGPGPAKQPPPADEARRYGWPRIPNHAFTVGETLTFAVQYGGLTAGYATLAIPDLLRLEGRPCFHVVATAKTIPFFETFFTVLDRIESGIDVDCAFSWHYEKHIHEGGFLADASYVYDQRAHQMREPAKGKQVAMPALAQDVLSCFYYFRTLKLAPGDHVTVPVTADDWKSYVLGVDVLRRERRECLAGTFDCLVVVPHMAFQGVFQQKGEVTLWVTDDARHIPVYIKSKIAIGSININLKDAEWVQPQN